MGVAIDHGHVRLRDIEDARLIEDARHSGQILQTAAAGGQVVHGQHGVCLAAAEGGLQLDHGLPTGAVETMGDLGEQQAHTLGDVRAFVEGRSVLILTGGAPVTDRRDVCCELGLLEGALQHVGMWNRQFSPSLHDSPPNRSSWEWGDGCAAAALSMAGQVVTISL